MNKIDLQQAEDALARLLGQMETERRYPDRPRDFKRYSVTDLMGMSDVEDLLCDPVRQACGRAVTLIGEHLHAHGVDMDAVAERVWSRAPEGDRGHWVSALTARWSGIGDRAS